MATDMAANSDSTLMNSQGASSPDATISPSASTMCVCGEIGYAQITSGRASATASATAREPSSCFSMERLIGGGGGGDVRLRHLAGELFADGAGHRAQGNDARERGEGAEQRRVRHRAADELERQLGRRHGAGLELVHQLADAEVG